MHDAESRALARAAVLLVAVSAVRWALVHTGGRGEPGATSVLPELASASAEAKEEGERRGRPLEPGERIDVNRADEVELDRLPGVGPALAAAIVATREEEGAFLRVDDLTDVRGIGPALLEKIRTHVEVGLPPPGARLRARGGGETERVDLNRAGLEELQTLPGVGPAIAERILARRRERPFGSVDELIEVRGIGPATLERLREHATVAPSR